MAQYDEEQMELAVSLAPFDCDRTACLRAFAILAGAAAGCAARLGDPVEFGDLPADERHRWNTLACVLMQAADNATPGGSGRAGRATDVIAALAAATDGSES